MKVATSTAIIPVHESNDATAIPQAKPKTFHPTKRRHGMIFDIETGPLPDDQLHSLYIEPTYEEFAANCDSRWKEETKREKFEQSKATVWDRFVERAALDATTGQILAIGYLHTEDGSTETFDVSDGLFTEKRLIKAFWNSCQSCGEQHSIIGHNIHGFDLPFLIRRSFILDVGIPAGVLENGRWFSQQFVDLMRVWACGVSGNSFVGLDRLARVFGIGAKNGDGAKFAELLANNPPDAREYLKNDLILTAEVARRLNIVA